MAVQRSLHNACTNRSGVRLTILPVRVYTSKGSKLVYALLDSGSEETFDSKNFYDEVKMIGAPLEVLLITANGSRNLVSAFDTTFKIGPVHNSDDKFDINQALVMNELPSIEQNFPTRDNLRFFKNTADLV